ncbi:ABC transporter substrate-binding protein [Rhodopirellula sallentina]|uniref:Periplasmic sugar-binding protein n=1 Tax=Rhodopirellula sallentina SM41 TaxID=1263870 RepID=M5UBP9_9BACT|nr:ABC transporter substrate-binding protein [Rhodopirellula sallentina]EMI53433.1 periplasmic sugar-binding protein [Rhodopirellula sallentina SM41]
MILQWIGPVVAHRLPKYSSGAFLTALLGCLFAYPVSLACGDERIDADVKPRVVVLIGSDEDDPFWIQFAEFMNVAAGQLGLDVHFHFADGSLETMSSLVRAECERNVKPSCLVVQSFKRGGLRFLRIANSYKVPVFLINSGLVAEQKEKAGEPRQHLKYWISQMLPDDYGAGFDLTNSLIDEAKKDPNRLGPDGRVHVIALGGTVSHGASLHRTAGLMDAIAARSDEAVLDQLVAADWKEGFARSRCRFLQRRYPDASVVWTANDQMAMGAIEAVRDRGLVPGNNLIVGGVDATRQAIKAIQDGSLSATVGGHFQEGGWVAVVLHDYFNGLELSRIPTHFTSPMRLITSDNVDDYQKSLRAEQWQRIDFKQFSKLDQPDSQAYHFQYNLPPEDSQIGDTQTSTQIGEDRPSVERSSSNE